MSQVFTVLYLMELVFYAVGGSLIGITAWVMWALDGRSRLLNQIERVLPLRGRWLRYLVGAVLLPVIAAAPTVVCFFLALLPALPGSLVLHAALGLLLWRVLSGEAKPEAERSRVSAHFRCPLIR